MDRSHYDDQIISDLHWPGGGRGGYPRAEDEDEAESLGTLGGAALWRLRQGDWESWLDEAAAAAAALPGPTSSANPAACDSRQVTSIRSLSSKCFAIRS